MKYGENFETESVPEWSLHNIDYNSLKHQIKVHTTRDQATAIAIPGHADSALAKFEDALYFELRRQHDRVGLFVSSKSDEISRRLQHLSDQVNGLILRVTTQNLDKLSPRKHRRFLKLEREVQRCSDDIQALTRFTKAQAIAFRKILKKYKKWTGSTTLGARFKENVLRNPKSFTNRDFTHLQNAYGELLATIRAATPPAASEAASPVDEQQAPVLEGNGSRLPPLPELETRVIDFAPGAIQNAANDSEIRYWNEYDYGSEAGDLGADGGYVIYVEPDENAKGFSGVAGLVALFKGPVGQMRGWFERLKGMKREGEPLLRSGSRGGYGTTGVESLSPTSLTSHDSDPENSYASSEEFPAGYVGHYAALPSINDQRMARYRERMLLWFTLASFALSVVLLGVSFILITVGRHKLRVEVDAGVTIGVVFSLGCACVGLVTALSRHDPLGWGQNLALWTVFGGVCILNGMVLVLVAGNTPV